MSGTLRKRPNKIQKITPIRKRKKYHKTKKLKVYPLSIKAIGKFKKKEKLGLAKNS